MANIVLANVKVEDLNLREEQPKVKVINIKMDDLWKMQNKQEVKPNLRTTSVVIPDYNKDLRLKRLNR